MNPKEDFGMRLKMPVVLGENKMFGKSKQDQMKLVDKDVGFAEDSWEFLKHAVADEGHCLGSYISTGDIKYLQELEKARGLRTEIMDILAKNVVAQEWCRIKHLAGKAITLQELCTRYLSVGDLEMAKKLAEKGKELYLAYLKILGFSRENLSYNTSA